MGGKASWHANGGTDDQGAGNHYFLSVVTDVDITNLEDGPVWATIRTR